MKQHEFWAFFIIALIAGASIGLVISHAAMNGYLSIPFKISQQVQPVQLSACEQAGGICTANLTCPASYVESNLSCTFSMPQAIPSNFPVAQAIAIQIAPAQNIQPVGKKCCIPVPKCLELFSGYNVPNAQNRFNLVFVGVNYTSISEFKNRAIELININGTLFGDDLLNESRDKFNFLYANKMETGSEDVLGKNICGDLPNKRNVVLVNGPGRSYAELSSTGTVIYDYLGTDILRNTTAHEFGHTLFGLCDEYNYGGVGCAWDEKTCPNCDIASNISACPKWCAGSPVPIEEIRDYDCSGFNDFGSCTFGIDLIDIHNDPCIWIDPTDPIPYRSNLTSCVNRVILCEGIESRIICDNMANNAYTGLCAWLSSDEELGNFNGSLSYFNSTGTFACIPTYTGDFEIGTNCTSNTNCYQDCGASNYFKSSLASRMRMIDKPWGYINEKRIREVFASLGTKASKEITHDNIIVWDTFNKQGEIVEGGAINLDKLDFETQTKIIKQIEIETGKKVAITLQGKIDINKINIHSLIDKYNELEKGNLTKNCQDGTQSGECSQKQPLFCEEGTLINKCSLCRCPAGSSCRSDGVCAKLNLFQRIFRK